MKKLILFALLAIIGIAANAQLDSARLAANVVEALKSGKVDELKKLVAPPDVYRDLYAETKGLTDEQIKEKTIESEKLKGDFENLMKIAKEKKIDLKKLQYDSLNAENPWGSDELPWSVTIHFSLNGKSSLLAISAFRHKGNWYFMEFLITTNAFKEF
jgi:hypothetical protein